MAESVSFFDDVEANENLYQLPRDLLGDPVYAPPGAQPEAAPREDAAGKASPGPSDAAKG